MLRLTLSRLVRRAPAGEEMDEASAPSKFTACKSPTPRGKHIRGLRTFNPKAGQD
jgi:hypothetical protein